MTSLRISLERSFIAAATVTCVVFPIGSVILFGSLILRARIVLGYWPSYNHPDPTVLDCGFHLGAAQLSMIAGTVFPIWIALVLLLPFTGLRADGWRLARATSFPWIAWFALVWSGHRFVEWCFD
jgi:hypothetical protein